MKKQIPEYPTPQQVEDCFAAYKKNGQQGIVEFLKRQSMDMETPVERENEESNPPLP